MVGAILLALLAAQASPAPSAAPAAAPPPGALRCALVTPRGDNVSFSLAGWSDQEDFVDLVADQGSAWPSRTLPGARGIMEGSSAAARMFAFGSGNGVALQVGDRGGEIRTAVLFRRDRQRASLPLAYGYCTPANVSMIYAPVDQQANAAEIGAGIPAFDPGQWTSAPCSLLLSDGRRVPFRFDLSGTGGNVSFSSPSLWAGRTVSASHSWAETKSGRPVGMINRHGGLTGSQEMVVDEPSRQAVRLIQLLDLGDPGAINQRGFAICGYTGLQRRPNLEMDVPADSVGRGGR